MENLAPCLMVSKKMLYSLVLCCLLDMIVQSGGENIVTSPGYPEKYTTADNGWFERIKVPSGRRVKLIINMIELHKDDKLLVYNGYYCSGLLVTNYLIKEYQGKVDNLPDILFMDGSEACVELQANKGDAKGFSITVQDIPDCGGMYEKDQGQDDIVSPYYPNSNYRYSTSCRWQFSLSPGQGVEYMIKDLDLAVSKGCAKTYIILTDAEGHPPNDKLCQPELKGQTIYSKRYESQLLFKSEYKAFASLKDTGHRGFWVRYKAIGCKTRELPKDVGTLTNPSDFYNYGYRAAFQCGPGERYANGDDFLYMQCDQDGSWSGRKQFCMETTCGQPEIPADGTVKLSHSDKIGSRATYCCNTGFKLEGAAVRVCLSSGRWSSRIPLCQGLNKTECSVPGDPANGRQIITGHEIGDTIEFRCDPGYILVGETLLTCLDGGVWDHQRPQCQARTCDVKLDAPPNGEITTTGNTYGSDVTYSCNAGYYLDGPKRRECTDSGDWSGSTPVCKEIRCQKPRPPFAGSVTGVDFHVGAVATFTCDRGYELNGPETVVCLETREWSQGPPICVAVRCPKPRNITNGYLATSVFTFGNEALFLCNSGFFFDELHTITSLKLTCLVDGKWNGEVLDCIHGKPIAVSATHQTNIENSVTSSAVFSLTDGITLTATESPVVPGATESKVELESSAQHLTTLYLSTPSHIPGTPMVTSPSTHTHVQDSSSTISSEQPNSYLQTVIQGYSASSDVSKLMPSGPPYTQTPVDKTSVYDMTPTTQRPSSSSFSEFNTLSDLNSNIFYSPAPPTKTEVPFTTSSSKVLPDTSTQSNLNTRLVSSPLPLDIQPVSISSEFNQSTLVFSNSLSYKATSSIYFTQELTTHMVTSDHSTNTRSSTGHIRFTPTVHSTSSLEESLGNSTSVHHMSLSTYAVQDNVSSLTPTQVPKSDLLTSSKDMTEYGNSIRETPTLPQFLSTAEPELDSSLLPTILPTSVDWTNTAAESNFELTPSLPKHTSNPVLGHGSSPVLSMTVSADWIDAGKSLQTTSNLSQLTSISDIGLKSSLFPTILPTSLDWGNPGSSLQWTRTPDLSQLSSVPKLELDSALLPTPTLVVMSSQSMTDEGSSDANPTISDLGDVGTRYTDPNYLHIIIPVSLAVLLLAILTAVYFHRRQRTQHGPVDKKHLVREQSVSDVYKDVDVAPDENWGTRLYTIDGGTDTHVTAHSQMSSGLPSVTHSDVQIQNGLPAQGHIQNSSPGGKQRVPLFFLQGSQSTQSATDGLHTGQRDLNEIPEVRGQPLRERHVANLTNSPEGSVPGIGSTRSPASDRFACKRVSVGESTTFENPLYGASLTPIEVVCEETSGGLSDNLILSFV